MGLLVYDIVVPVVLLPLAPPEELLHGYIIVVVPVPQVPVPLVPIPIGVVLAGLVERKHEKVAGVEAVVIHDHKISVEGGGCLDHPDLEIGEADELGVDEVVDL